MRGLGLHNVWGQYVVDPDSGKAGSVEVVRGAELFAELSVVAFGAMAGVGGGGVYKLREHLVKVRVSFSQLDFVEQPQHCDVPSEL